MLTAEVLWSLSCLPRAAFLAEVLRHAHGADAVRMQAAAEVEEAEVTLLPEQIELGPDRLVVQPDATVISGRRTCSLKPSAFGARPSKSVNFPANWWR